MGGNNGMKVRFPIFIKLMSLLIATILITVAAIGLESVRSAKQALQERILYGLDAVATEKVQEITSLVEQDFERVALIASRTNLRECLAGIDDGDPHPRRLAARMNQILDDALHSLKALETVSATDGRGKIVASTDRSLIGNQLAGSRLFRCGKAGRCLGSLESGIEGLSYEIAATMVHPKERTFIGVIVVKIKLLRLAEVLSDHTGLGRTGELILGKRKGARIEFVDWPRHPEPDAPIRTMRVDSGTFEPLRSAMERGKGITVAQDYRSVEVLAAYRYVSIGDWGLVAKIDTREAFQPITALQKKVTLLGSLLAFLAVACGYLASKAVSRRIQALQTGVERISGGQLDYRIQVEGRDELGQLGLAFNHMAAQLNEDIARRKQAEEALREREAFIRNILDTVDEGFIVLDPEYGILSVNRAFCEMVALSEDRVIGRPCYEVTHHKSRPCFDTGEECPVQHTFQTGKSHFTIHSLKAASGAEKHIELKSYPITDASGAVVSVIETLNDVTGKRKLEEQLRQAQKMEAIGQLAGGVAHDFNNMLGVIIGHAELAMDWADPGQPLYAGLQEILNAAKRSSDLTRQLLAFARKQTATPRKLNLNQTIEGMLQMLRRLIGEQIELVWLPKKDLWPVKVDPTQIDQILATLCLNARDAIAGVGKITIETGTANFDEAFCADRQGVVPGDYVFLALSDTGCGMDKQIQDKIFEPFFSTKLMGKSSGLGLATVYGIVKQNNGFINVYSEPGYGSTFKIHLPRHADGTGRIPEDDSVVSASPLVGGSETLLLVEDDAAVLAMGRVMLERLGYQVLVAATPGEAIRAAELHAGRIQLLVTDVVMPEMNGRELAKHLHSRCPGFRCLFMSGYTADVIAHHGVLDEGVNFIQKPFSMQTLAAKVREVLDGP